MDTQSKRKTSFDQKKQAFWEKFHSIHLYPTKGESFFKAMVITISWSGGVYMNSASGNLSDEVGVAFYLFSLSLIMEYVISMLSAKKIGKKLLPFLIVVCSVAVFISSCSILANRTFEFLTFERLLWATIIPQVFIWFDALTMIIIEAPPEKPIETKLKGC